MQVPFQHSVHPSEHPDLPEHAAGHLNEHHQQLHGKWDCWGWHCMNLWSVHIQNIGVLYRLIIGCQHPLMARLNNDCLYTGFYMFLTTNCCITIFRILLVIKVTRNDHSILYILPWTRFFSPTDFGMQTMSACTRCLWWWCSFSLPPPSSQWSSTTRCTIKANTNLFPSKQQVTFIDVYRPRPVADWVLPDWKQERILYTSNSSLAALGVSR